MYFNPIEVQKHLKDADYPASGEELASVAESNNASNELIEKLRSLGDTEFSGPDKVMAALNGAREDLRVPEDGDNRNHAIQAAFRACPTRLTRLTG